MKKFIIIYPHDETSSFLLTPFHLLQNKLKSATFYEVFPNDDSHKFCLNLIKRFENIVFMGHGSHSSLCGAKSNVYSQENFLNHKSINEFGKKNWILFSCNSCDLIKNCTNVNAIGFGNLPTSFGEIQGAREFEVNAYKGVTYNSIIAFQEAINWIIKEVITSLVNNNLSCRDTYKFCKLLITKRMIKSLSNLEHKAIVGLLFDMKSELNLVERKI